MRTTLAEYASAHFERLNEKLKALNLIDLSSQHHPASVELIKPWLRGRDIRKWKAEWAGLYFINLPSSANHEWPWSKAKTESIATRLFEQTYPAVLRHLSQWKKQLQKRDDQGRLWWELRSCAYYDAFENPIITWGNLATVPKFAFDDSSSYVSAPANIIPTDDLYLLAILNSPLSKWWNSMQAAVRAGGFLEYKPMYVGKIPVAQATDSQKAPIIQRTQVILSDPDSHDVPRLEAEINNLVYNLYNLTPGEIKIIEG